MATKKVTYLGSQLAEIDEQLYGFICDDESGLHFVSDSAALPGESQVSFAAKQHVCTESRNPIWNQVTYKVDSNVTASDVYEGHVTLQGIKDDGLTEDLMEHIYTATTDTTEIRKFDLLGSACTSDTTKRTPASETAGSFAVETPLDSSKYETFDIMPSWYDPDWAYRNSLPISKTDGPLQGAVGRTQEYHVMPISVIYDAHMNADFSDIRFCGPDGRTPLAHYIIEKTDSTSAVFLVAIPYYFLTLENEKYVSDVSITGGGTAYSNTKPIYVYFYYGNATATTESDITLDGVMDFYDDFNDDSIDTTKWPTVSAPTYSTITESGGLLTFNQDASQTALPQVISQNLPYTINGNDAFEVLWDIREILPLSSAYTTTSDGVILRLYLDDNNHSGVYAYYYAGGYYSGTSAGRYWALNERRAGTFGTYQNFCGLGTTTGATRFIKCSVIPNYTGSKTGASIQWKASRDGVKWETIGHQYVGNFTGTPKVAMYYNGKSGVATAKKVSFNAVYVYPIIHDSAEYLEDTFINEIYGDRWEVFNTDANRIISESGGQLRIRANNTNVYWAPGTLNSPLLYSTSRMGAYTNAETLIYETCINTINTPPNSAFHGAGMFIGGSTTKATSEYIIHSLIVTTNAVGVTTHYIETKFISNDGASGPVIGTSPVVAGAPAGKIYLRIVIEKSERRAHFQYSYDGIYWKTGYSHPINTSGYANISGYLDNETLHGLFVRANNANRSPDVYYDYYRAKSGPCTIFEDGTTVGEEAYANYPLTITSSTGTKATFTTPATIPRNAPMILRLKQYGAGTESNSKISYITDQDYISIGPEGLDKFIGMRLEFDFSLTDTDEFAVTEINFLYEVI